MNKIRPTIGAALLAGACSLYGGTISIVPLTDDASSGISSGNSYTHAISGGSAATVNGVTFEALTSTETPANFTWDTDGTGRPLDLAFTHGAESDSAGTVPEDRPGTVLGGGSDQQAYFVNYQFTALDTQLDITAQVAAIGGANSGSAHMYALSNQVAIPEPSSLALAGLGFLALLRRRRD